MSITSSSQLVASADFVLLDTLDFEPEIEWGRFDVAPRRCEALRSQVIAELDVSDITRIAREAAAEHSLAVEVVGAVCGGEDSAYVEIFVHVERSAIDSQFVIGVFRNTPEPILSHEIAVRLRALLKSQR